MKKILAILLGMLLVLSLMPAFANELTVESPALFIELTTPPQEGEQPAQQAEEPAEEAEAAEEPVEETEEPAEEEAQEPEEEVEEPVEETEEPVEEAEPLEPMLVAVAFTSDYDAPYYYDDEITLYAYDGGQATQYSWEMSVDGCQTWQAVPGADGSELKVRLDAQNANALWRVTASSETALGVSQPVGAFGATEYIPDRITISMSAPSEAPYAYGDVLHFHADYFTLSDNPRVVWESSTDGESWAEIPGSGGQDLTVIVSEATDGIQVRAKLLTDDTVE